MENVDIDFVYGCYRCRKLVYQYQIEYGKHCCYKCGSNKVVPVQLTKFGIWYCELINKIGIWYYEEIKSGNFKIRIIEFFKNYRNWLS